MAVIITTPRPPLNLFEVVRVDVTADWTAVYETPVYRVPALGPTPTYDIEAAAIMTGVIVTNTSVVPTTVSARIIGTDAEPYALLTDIQIPIGDYILLDMNRQVLKSGEIMQLQCGLGTTATAHLSFVLNQREQFEVVV